MLVNAKDMPGVTHEPAPGTLYGSISLPELALLGICPFLSLSSLL
ncbi:MAG: hypothetical protein OJF49_000615 [Ktedonobacterales bacterium]|nr:MAG: hypothetical protein OJF49_000615 [Ktedonobacterales bacterium]